MTTLQKFSFLLVAALFLFSACNNSDDPTDLPQESTGDATDFQKMVIDYGLSTFQNVIAEGEENVLISPLSLETALYMTMNGSNGKTLEEFRVALKADKFYPPEMNSNYKSLIEKLAPKNESTTLGLANTVFYDKTKVEFHDEFQDIIKETFDGDFNQADFKDSETVNIINQWAKDKTEDRIDKILDNIDPDEALFLINALYFKSDWMKGFAENSVIQRPFTKENGDDVLVDMMFSDDFRRFYIGEDFSALDLRFTDDEYSMTFILPEDKISAADFINDYTEEDFYDLYIDLYANKLNEGRIYSWLPKFEIEAHRDMKDVLAKMGMETAFQNSDLSKMGNFSGPTKLSRVLHDTFLKIDERGVEGAAVTTVGIVTTSAPPSIEFNKPFVFIIRHVETNTPIFIGKLGDPK